jgi:hypothetical protein
MLVVLLYITFGNTILDEYGGSAPEIAISFVAIKTFFFGLMLFLPSNRKRIRLVLYVFCIGDCSKRNKRIFLLERIWSAV